ncbi:nucleotidyltransferase domain-containing protein [Candidatus Woesearchaeota archaeon]|nr:nucleotidyltransferase domain-containing protein [Candidatus Woesearchaeota archaeon]
MGSPSKEDKVLELLLENSPLKHWHFEEIVKEAKMTRAAVNKWLKKYIEDGMIGKTKDKGKFPYFTCGEDNPVFKAKKKMYMLNKIYRSGMIAKIISLEKIKTAIIFGSAAKGDWYKESDIDLFIYGNPKGLNKHEYELKLRKNIELHVFRSKEEIKEVKTGLVKNVIGGYVIKGSVQDFAEVRI